MKYIYILITVLFLNSAAVSAQGYVMRFYEDKDNDACGIGSGILIDVSTTTPTAPYTAIRDGDCDDNNKLVQNATIWFYDNDGDGFGSTTSYPASCSQPFKGVKNNTDCDDNNPLFHELKTWYGDGDGDGFGSIAQPVTFCGLPPSNAVENKLDSNIYMKGSFMGNPTLETSRIASALSDKNYFLSITPKQPVTDLSSIANSNDVIMNITYLDGIGRPIQKIANGQSTSGKDIITHIQYDNMGRMPIEKLPYPSTQATMLYSNNTNKETFAYYSAIYGLTYVYSEKIFEKSALGRVLNQGAPGVWNAGGGNDIKFDYQTNATNEVKFFKAIATWNPSQNIYDISISSPQAYFNQNELYKTVIKDENWKSYQTNLKNNTTEEFKNNLGQVVLKRTYNDGIPHDTYYVYDDYGNLTYVISPKALDFINITSIQSNINSPNPANSETSFILNSGATLQLTASNSIHLLPGFNAKSGSVFSAKIDDSVQNTLDNLCYQYKYDSRNRLVEKKLPGKEWEYIVYNKLDKPILTQDANLRTQNKWLFTKYDAFGRVVYTGDYKNILKTSRTAMQSLADAAITLWETKQSTSKTINETIVNYNNVAFPYNDDLNINLFAINYYDDYSNVDLKGADVAYGITPLNSKGLATVNKVRILETSSWTTNVSYYDDKGRSIYSYSKNDYLETVTTVKNKLNFIGQVLETTSTHQKNSITTSIVDAFTYDHAGRFTKQTQAINGTITPEVIAVNKYDELGQLIEKGVGGKTTTTNRLQTIDYTYNIRGWLKTINDVNAIGSDLFAFKINYNDISDDSKKLYNGNISQTLWKTNNTDASLKNYTYSYDALNRLILAESQDSGRYNESFSYDKNGNIMNLTRKGYTDINATILGTMDNLVYTYNNTNTGNKLMKVTDSSGSTEGFKDGNTAGDDYSYDDNGNMTKDLNKGITTAISYNHLNLPTQITFATGNIQYVYDATGLKLQKKVVENGKSDIYTKYAGSFIYEKTGTAADVLKFFSQPEGYVAYNSGTYDYIYQYKDHLGNIRLSYDKNLTVIEENNYYPFGLKQKGYNKLTNYSYGNAQAQKYKYNGKELQDENIGGSQLNLYDYGARNYDPALGRWMNIDPLAEKYPSIGGYTYCANNPIIFKDPDGRDIVYFDVMGNELANKRVVSNKVFQTHIARDKENTSFSQVPMPNVIQERTQSGEDVSGSEYQENDYIISARTGLFNQTKNAGLLQLYTEGGDAIPKDEASKIPDLDPTLVKAIATQESHNGTTGVADIMTANGVGSDFKPFKTKYGLSKTESLNVNRSLYLGIRFLATKGFRSGVTYDKKTGAKTYTFQGWNTATGNYNGGGVEGYQGYVETMVDDSKKTTPTDH